MNNISHLVIKNNIESVLLDRSILFNSFLKFHNINNTIVNKYIKFFLEEDLGYNLFTNLSLEKNINNDILSRDITTMNINTDNKIVKFNIVVKDNNYSNIKLSGIFFVLYVFKFLDINAEILYSKKDGDVLQKGDVVLEGIIEDNKILLIESTILNIIQQLSAVSTQTYHLQENVNNFCKTNNINAIKILETRKTMLGSRLLQKYAVFVSTNFNHRFGLYDKILIKDNHIDSAGGIKNVVEKLYVIKNTNQSDILNNIEIECETEEQILYAVKHHKLFKRIMLDNFNPMEIAKFVKIIKDNSNLEIEVSGGINKNNILQYCVNGVDFISLGSITHSLSSIDFSLNTFDFKK